MVRDLLEKQHISTFSIGVPHVIYRPKLFVILFTTTLFVTSCYFHLRFPGSPYLFYYIPLYYLTLFIMSYNSFTFPSIAHIFIREHFLSHIIFFFHSSSLNLYFQVLYCFSILIFLFYVYFLSFILACTFYRPRNIFFP
jgi:hypothetical protein